METDLRPPLLCLHSSSAPLRLILPLCITAVVQDQVVRLQHQSLLLLLLQQGASTEYRQH